MQVDLVTFLVMKGMALDDRLKEKDAWDIYYSVRNYPRGLDAPADELRPHPGHGLVKEGVRKITKHFASPSHATAQSGHLQNKDVSLSMNALIKARERRNNE